MAVQHSCSPYAAPRFIQNMDEESSILGDALRRQEEQGNIVKPRKGFDPEYAARAAEDLDQMLPLPLEEFGQYLQSKGWIKQTKDGNFKLAVMRGEEEGYAASVTKTYLESVAGGVKQLGENFLNAAKAGEDATVQGLRFAQQLRYMASFGEAVLGWDQSYGRAMRMQALRNGGRGLREVDSQLDELGSAADELMGHSNKLDQIAAGLQDPASQADAINDLLTIAEQVKLLDDPNKVAKGSMGITVAGDAWREWTINSMLSNPGTWMANASGALWVPMRAFSQLGGSVLLAAVSPSEARTTWAQSVAQLGAMNGALTDAAQIFWQALKTDRSIYSKTFEKGITGAAINRAFGGGIGQEYMGLLDTIGMVVRAPSRFLMATDEFAKHLALRGEVVNRGVRKALENGIDIADKAGMEQFLKSEVEQAFYLPTAQAVMEGKKPAWGLNKAYDLRSGREFGSELSYVADTATFQESNAFAQAIDKAIAKAPVLKPFVPFVKTPTNILKQAIFESTLLGPLLKLPGIAVDNRLSPVGMIVDIQKRMLANPAETARVSGQIAFTTAIGALLYSKAVSGEVTGGGPERWMDQAQGRVAQQAWIKAGNTPYSWRMGDTVIPFTRFPEPVATLMRIYADLGMASGYMTQEERDEAFALPALIAVTGLYQSSMLTGVERLLSIPMGGVSGFDRNLGAAVQQWFATQTPMGGLMSFVDQIDDPYKAAYQAPSFSSFFTNFEDIYGTGILAKVAQRFPGGSSQQPVQIDQLGGEPVPIYPGVGPNGLNPMLNAIPLMPRNVKADPAWQAVFEISGGWTDYKPSQAKLTVWEQQELNREMGTLRIGGLTLAQAILQFRARPDVRQYVEQKGMTSLEAGTQIDRELKALRRAYGSAAFNRLLARSVSIQQRFALAEQQKQFKRENNVDGVKTAQSRIDELLQRARRGY